MTANTPSDLTLHQAGMLQALLGDTWNIRPVRCDDGREHIWLGPQSFDTKILFPTNPEALASKLDASMSETSGPLAQLFRDAGAE